MNDQNSSIHYYKTPCVGWIRVVVLHQKIQSIRYCEEGEVDQNDNLPKFLASALHRFFIRHEKFNSDAFDYNGTDFQNKVWTALLDIPWGQTLSYLELANRINSAPRAVGQACKKNPIPILIPCHRVVAKTHIGGYEGETGGFKLDRKKELLKFEGVEF